jgi:deoxycytidylate deaminase
MTMINDRKMQLARKVSLLSTFRVRIGAVAVKNKSIVGVGCNKRKTHPIISVDNHRKIHAELSACIGVDRRELNGAVMYVYRENKMGEIANCKPCQYCQAILKEVGIKKVYYTSPKEIGCVGKLEFRR